MPRFVSIPLSQLLVSLVVLGVAQACYYYYYLEKPDDFFYRFQCLGVSSCRFSPLHHINRDQPTLHSMSFRSRHLTTPVQYSKLPIFQSPNSQCANLPIQDPNYSACCTPFSSGATTPAICTSMSVTASSSGTTCSSTAVHTTDSRSASAPSDYTPYIPPPAQTHITPPPPPAGQSNGDAGGSGAGDRPATSTMNAQSTSYMTGDGGVVTAMVLTTITPTCLPTVGAISPGQNSAGGAGDNTCACPLSSGPADTGKLSSSGSATTSAGAGVSASTSTSAGAGAVPPSSSGSGGDSASNGVGGNGPTASSSAPWVGE
jgi:hypothetical protein